MKLKKVQIRNFRSIKSEDIEFRPQCRVLVGINESGKSNILDALSLLSEDYKPHPEDEREQLPDETDYGDDAFVRFVFDITEDPNLLYQKIMEKVVSGVGVKIAQRDKETFTIKQYCNLFKEGLYQVDVKTGDKRSTYWDIQREEYQILEGWKKPSASCPDSYQFTDSAGQTIELKKMHLIKPKEEWGVPDEHLENVSIDDLYNLVTQELTQFIDNNLPDIVYWKYVEDQLLPEKIDLNEFADNADKFAPLKNMFFLAGELQIKEAIEAAKQKGANPLNNLLRRVATKNTEYFQKVWREYREIKFSLTMDGAFIKCSVSEKNDFAFQKRSDGFKKFIAFLLTVSTKSHTGSLNNALLLIDEPDSGLHPSGARYLRDELIKISQSNYVVYSTHSIFMIDRHNIERHLIITKEDEVTTTQVANEGNISKEEVIFNAINYSTFEHLREVNIVLEGWRDRKLFEVATKHYEATFFKKIGIGHAEGAPTYKCFIPTLELAERKALIVSDSDSAAKQSQKEYRKLRYKTEWKRYDEISSQTKAKTGEDFLTKEYLISKLKTVSKQHGKEIVIAESAIPDNARLSYIRQQIRNGGYDEQQTKKLLHDFKTLLFDGLQQTKIESSYQDFLAALKLYIEGNLFAPPLPETNTSTVLA